MPIWLHLTLALITQYGGAVGSFAVALRAFMAGKIHGTVVVGAFVLGYLIPRLLFKYGIPAKCPRCGGRSYWRGNRPVSYLCITCDFVHETDACEGRREEPN
jgi:hypothetical protein